MIEILIMFIIAILRLIIAIPLAVAIIFTAFFGTLILMTGTAILDMCEWLNDFGRKVLGLDDVTKQGGNIQPEKK